MKDELQDQDDFSTSADSGSGIASYDEFDEVFSGRGFVMALKGRFILMDTSRSEEEHQAILEDLASHREELWDSIEQQVQELEEILSEFEPFDIIGNISFANAILDAETYKEYLHEGNDAYTEYVALLYLTKPYEAYSERGIEPIPGTALQDIQDRVKKLFFNTVFYFAVKDVDPGQTESLDALTQLRLATLSRSFMVRYMAYHHHLIDVLTGAFTPLRDELEQTLGFDIEDALTLVKGIESLIGRRLAERRDKAKGFEKKLKKAVKRYRQKGRGSGDIPSDLLERLADIRPSESAQTIRNMMIAWTFFALGETLSFTLQDLVDETDIPKERVEAFLEKMSLEFGSVEPRYRIPSPTHPLMKRPLIRHQQRYFCPVFNLVLWSLRPAIEAYLNPDDPEAVNSDGALWERYNQVRAKYVEEKAIQYLEEALQHAEVYNNLTYRVSENNKMKEVELDGLVMLDSALFLVEAKAGSLSLPARRGAPKGMIEEIKELIEQAYLQALRAKRYIQEADDPTFFLSDGTVVKVPKDRFDRIFLVTVTLEPMDAFVTTLYQLQDLGLFTEGDLPWAVCLTDLRVISELIEFPSQLVHYLTRRHRLNELGRVTAHDELDWFGHYLREGLFFDDIFLEEDSPDFINLLSYTTDFDDYYFYVTGQRKTPVPKPAQPMPEIMRQILAELETHHSVGYLDAACALLDMGGDARKTFVENIASQRERTLKDCSFHDFSLGFGEPPGFGITYVFAPSGRVPDLRERLAGYCELKKYQTKSDLWIGLGCIVDAPGWAQIGIVFKGPWNYDEEMERLVADTLPPMQATQDLSTPTLVPEISPHEE